MFELEPAICPACGTTHFVPAGQKRIRCTTPVDKDGKQLPDARPGDKYDECDTLFWLGEKDAIGVRASKKFTKAERRRLLEARGHEAEQRAAAGKAAEAMIFEAQDRYVKDIRPQREGERKKRRAEHKRRAVKERLGAREKLLRMSLKTK